MTFLFKALHAHNQYLIKIKSFFFIVIIDAPEKALKKKKRIIKSNESDIRKNALQEVFFCVHLARAVKQFIEATFFSDFFFQFYFK